MTSTNRDKDATLEEHERAGTLETRIPLLRALILLLSRKNSDLENMLASLRLKQSVGERVEDKDSESTEREPAPFPPLFGKLRLMAVVVVGVIGVWMLWPESDRSDHEIKKQLVFAQKKATELESALEEYKEKLSLSAVNPNSDAAVNPVSEKVANEIKSLHLQNSKLRKAIEDLQESLSVLEKVKDQKVAKLETNIELLEKKNRTAVEDGRKQKASDREMMKRTVNQINRMKMVAIPSLIDVLDHPDMDARLAASQALSTLAGASCGTDQEKWRRWWKQNRISFIQKP